MLACGVAALTYFLLGHSWEQVHPQLAVGYFRVAVAVRPSSDQAFAKLANALRDFRRDRRDVNREQALEASSARVEAWLAAEQSSPSERAERSEEAARLAAAIETLPEPQRQVVVLRHFHHWSLHDISREVGRSVSAVASLLHRGLVELRAKLQEPDHEPGG